MLLGFDAKRAFFNRSGLGNYSRDTISILSEYFPLNEHVLYTPKPLKSHPFNNATNNTIRGPESALHKLLPAYWRTYGLAADLKKHNIQLFHGLSNELPVGIDKYNIPSAVTVHDIIFMRYPNFYPAIDRSIYEKKFRYAAKVANKIISVSNQTKDDLIEYFGISENKIEVVYQGCNPIFWNEVAENQKRDVLQKYNIPNGYMLYVGTIEERKNILSVLKAIEKEKIATPLVIVGKPTEYFAKVKAFTQQHQMHQVFFLNNVPTDDLPALYQMAEVFIYPSLFEGFGIPIIEALTSKVPVITSRGGCFAEAGGPSTLYVDAENPDNIADTLKMLLNNPTLRTSMRLEGYAHAQQFKQDKIAQNMMRVYKKII